MDYEVSRPKTADLDAAELSCDEQRPFTSSTKHPPPSISKVKMSKAAKLTTIAGEESSASRSCVTGSEVHMVLSSNWGDPSCIGLTGIALLDSSSKDPIMLRPDQVNLSIPFKGEDGGGALVDGVNVTTDVAHMWACTVSFPLDSNYTHGPTLVIKLDHPSSLKGIRVWNYNASLEDSYKGVGNLANS